MLFTPEAIVIKQKQKNPGEVKKKKEVNFLGTAL